MTYEFQFIITTMASVFMLLFALLLLAGRIPEKTQSFESPVDTEARHFITVIHYLFPIILFGYILSMAYLWKPNMVMAEKDLVVTIEKIELTKQTPIKGVSTIWVKINRKIPNDTGRIIFSDDKYAEIGEYNPPIARTRLKDTDILRVFLDETIAPLGMKTTDDLRNKLPLKVKVVHRN